MADNKFIARTHVKNGLTTEITMGDHKIISDQSTAAGGHDEGACPASLLSAAIAGCQAMLVHVLAQKQKLNIRHCEIEVTGELADDYAKTSSGFHDVYSVFHFDSDEPQEKLDKLVEQVEKICPVMNSLKKAPTFHTEIKVERS